MSLDNEDLANDFIRRFDEMRNRGIEINRVIAEVLTTTLGETPAFAVMYIVGKKAMNNPSAFADKLTKVFGYATKIVFEELLSESEKYPPYIAVQRQK